MAGLAKLADAVAGLRQAQEHAAQAAAARQAAEQLHTAFTQARGRMLAPGRAETRLSEPGPATRAGAEFPAPLAEVLPRLAAAAAACCFRFPAALSATARPRPADTLMPVLPKMAAWLVEAWRRSGVRLERQLRSGPRGASLEGDGRLGGGDRGGLC